jgi:hypothetical protein
MHLCRIIDHHACHVTTLPPMHARASFVFSVKLFFLMGVYNKLLGKIY